MTPSRLHAALLLVAVTVAIPFLLMAAVIHSDDNPIVLAVVLVLGGGFLAVLSPRSGFRGLIFGMADALPTDRIFADPRDDGGLLRRAAEQ